MNFSLSLRTTVSTQHHPNLDRVDDINTSQATSYSSSQEESSAPAITSTFPSVLSREPSQEAILEAVKRIRETSKSSTEDLAHYLEHLDGRFLMQHLEKKVCSELLIILEQKFKIRQEYERLLERFSKMGLGDKEPTCFICFAFEEEGKPDDVRDWLENCFVPDLILAGMNPVFSRYHLSLEQNVPAFEEQIQTTDKVVIICTRILKEKCVKRQHNPTGVAREVRLATKRNDYASKKNTTFLVYLEGNQEEHCPHPDFKNNLVTFLSQNSSGVRPYYSGALDLCAALRGVQKEIAIKSKKHFFQTVKEILADNVGVNALEAKLKYQHNLAKERINSIPSQMVRQMKQTRPPPPPHYFCGRDNELQEIEDLYKQGKHHVAIVGPSGIGKSGLIWAIALKCQALFNFICVIQVSGHSSLKPGKLKLANDLNFGGTENERLSTLENWLKRLNRDHLIMLDNVNDNNENLVDEIKEFKDSLDCSLLMTTIVTKSFSRLGFEMYSLKPLPINDSATFLQKATSLPDEEGARKLAENLHGFPVALVYAADYISRMNLSFTSFLKKFQREGTKLLAFDCTNHARRPLIPWREYLKKIEVKMQNQTCASQILAFFAESPNKIVTFDELDTWSEERNFGDHFPQSLAELIDFALILCPSRDNYALHPLISTEIVESPRSASPLHNCHKSTNSV